MKSLSTKIGILFCFLLLLGNSWAQLNYLPVSSGNFSSTWTDLGSNGNAITSFSTFDDENSGAENIGFNFDFNGTTYTQMIINTNGFIKLGNSNPSSAALFYSTATGIAAGALNSTSDVDLICVFNHDLTQGSGTPEIRVETSGNSGSQVTTIQWKNFKDKTNAGQFDNISFQVKLFEGSNKIQFIYGPFTSSGNAAAAKTVGIGLHGSSANTADVITVTKASATTWDNAVFQQGHYTANAHNVRNTTLPDSGRTYEFIPQSNFDAAVTHLYTLGKMAIPFAVPQPTEVRIQNVGKDTIGNFWVYLESKGTNSFLDSIYVSDTIGVGGKRNITFVNFTATSLGIDTVRAFISNPNDQNPNNDSKYFLQDVNLNSFSYSEAKKGPAGGVGFTGGTGDFVAKFTAPNGGLINQIKLNYTTTGLSTKVGIWDIDANSGKPNNRLWASASFQTNGGLSVISVNPPVAVSGDFFVGAIQTNTTNVGFAFQNEVPIRDSVFYYTAPTGNTTWTDFSASNCNFRFMIEPRFMIKRDVGVVKIISPKFDTCMGATKMDLIFQIQNLGTDTIDLSTDSINVYSNMINANQDTISLPVYTVKGGIFYPNDTLYAKIMDTLSMMPNGDYYFWAYTTHKGDSNQVNDTLDIVHYVSNNPTPIIELLSAAKICPGDTAILSVGKSDGVLFQWYRGATMLNNATDTVYYATIPGRYHCAVTSGTGCVLHSDSITISNFPKPTINAIQTNSGFCSGDSVLLIDNFVNTNTYQWYYNSNPISGATDTSYYANQAGDYYLVVTDTGTGCKATSSTFSISVLATPTATISATTNARFCLGDSVELDGSASTNGNYYKWYKDGNLISGAPNSKYIAKQAGDYSLQVVNTSGCSKISNTITVVVDSLPDATITSNRTNATVCDGDTITLSVPNNTGNTYEWFEALSGSISGATSFDYSTIFGGDYYCEVKNASGCKSKSAVITVTIVQNPYAQIKQPTNTSTCPGDSLKIEANTVPGGKYQWIKDGNDIPGATDSFYWAKKQGDYTLRITNANGCVSETITSTSLFFNGGPEPKVSFTGSAEFCEGDSLYLNASANSPMTFQWKKNGVNITGANGQLYLAKTSGNYSVFVSDSQGCSDESDDTTITVNPKPTVNITKNGNILSSTTGTNWTYQWYFNGNVINGATGKDLTATQDGKYKVEVVDDKGCVNSSELSVTITGFELPDYISSAQIWPNPSKDEFMLLINAKQSEKVQLKVIDILGKTVIDLGSNSLYKGSNTIAVNINNLKEGVYLLQISNQGNSNNLKFIKE